MELDKIFKILIRNDCITTYELTKIGYIDEDIAELISDGYLKRKERGVYVLANPDKLLEYAKNIEERRPDFSKELMDYYNLITGVDVTPYYELFDKAIQDKDYNNIITYYKLIDDLLSKNNKNTGNSNLYLMLIGYLYELDDEYREKIDNINLDDMLLSGDDDVTKLENKLRKDLFFKSYYEARISFKKKISMQGEFSLEDKIEKDLISAVIEKYRNLKEEIINLINNNEFKDLLVLLYKEEDMNFLNVKSSYLLKTVIDYLEIEKSKKVPYIIGEHSNTFQAIKHKDYKKALEFMKKRNEEKNINYQDTLYLMLLKINELIETLEKSNEKTFEKVEVKPKKEKQKVEVKKEEKQKIVKEEPKVKEKKEEIKEVVIKKDIVKQPKKVELEAKDIKRIDKQVQEIYDGKLLIILEKVDYKKNDLVVDYLKSFKEITAFIIGNGDKSKVVIKSKPYLKEKYVIMDLVNEAKNALYKDRDYKKAEEIYRLLLQIGNPRDITYGEYGLTLLKLHRRREAIPYLKIATELSREHGRSIDYSDLILNIDGTIKKSEAKPVVRMKEEDFQESKTFDLKLDYLDDLVNLVLEDELELEDAMTKLGLDEENKNYIRLICARDCYYQERYKDGDKYLLDVQKSHAKNNDIKRILKQIYQSRKYYKNRLNRNEENQLVFRK